SAGDTVAVHNALDLGEGFKLNAGNAQAFLALRDQPVFDNGTTLSDGFAGTMAVIGTRTQSARYAAELSSTLAKSLDAERSAVSGVNLDEEAARLLQYQQAYQASAKIIQTAQTLFDSVLNVIGR
ncbi:MAG: flagellar basal body rod C-terminal domain-containing protein, partial [Comamonas sp.]